MSIIDKLFRKQPRFDYRNFNVSGNVPPDRNVEGFLRAYGQIGWLYAVVFRIALGCSEVKWTLHDTSNRVKPRQIFEHPILKLLNLVNPFMTSNEFIALDTIYQELIGESFWILNFNALGEPAEIWIPYPHKMSVVPSKENFIKGYVYGTGADAVPFNVNEVIHFKYPNPLNAYRGLGPAQSIGVDLDAEMYSGIWNRQFFYNSARPDGVIQFDYNLSDEQFDKLSKQWNSKYKGTSKAHQVALLEGGGKYVQIQNTVKDMDFYSLKKMNRDVILGVYGMPQSVMGISENVNKANAEAGDYTFARWIVKPRLDWRTAKLQEQLVPKFRKADKLQMGFEEVVPKTIEQKRDLAESGMRAGYLTINEARIMQGLDTLPNGDMLLVPLNLRPTDINKPMKPPEEPNEPEDVVEESFKGLTDDHKSNLWSAYAQKTERQAEMFTRVFDSVFDEQKELVIAEFNRTGHLPELDDVKTAKKFEPAIELVYSSAFEDAV
uniref:Putative portal protein n=1 Tax=viral metagenome TaxID=1070528 RepID=A0A6M3KIC8_9ZZZZ